MVRSSRTRPPRAFDTLAHTAQAVAFACGCVFAVIGDGEAVLAVFHMEAQWYRWWRGRGGRCW